MIRCPQCQQQTLPTPGTPPAKVTVFGAPTGIIIRYKQISWFAVSLIFSFALSSAIDIFGHYYRSLTPPAFDTTSISIIRFLIIFAAILWGIPLLFGRYEIRDNNGELTLFVGIGPLSIRHRFHLNDISRIEVKSEPSFANTVYTISIKLKNGKFLSYFSNTDADAVRYFCAYLRQRAKLETPDA